MPSPSGILKIFTGVYIILILSYCFFYLQKNEFFLQWTLTSTAESEVFSAQKFNKGIFKFDLVGKKYAVEENFAGGSVQDTTSLTDPFMALLWLGIAYLLTCFSFFKRYTFVVLNALLVLFLIDLNLESIGVFGFLPPSRLGTLVVILLLLGPGYIFHVFLQKVSFLKRLLTYSIILVSLGTYFITTIPHFTTYLSAGINNGSAIILLLFLLLITEEIVFLILHIVTMSRNKHNQRHFVLVAVIYLALVTSYFLKKSGIYPNIITFIDPFMLLVVSALVALWTLPYKQDFFSRAFKSDLDLRHLLLGTGLVGLSYLNMGFISGNDPLYESFHYLITYAHVGFGASFFLYVVMNFVDALIAGHPVYKIVYKERNFPYLTAKLVGVIAIAAFFLMAKKEALELTQAAKLNSLGDYESKKGNIDLADQYFLESTIFGYNGHYSNYRMADYARRKGKIQESTLRYELASRRFPTPQAYVNASVMVKSENITKATVLLQNAKLDFPKTAQIDNNLANIYINTGRLDEAWGLLNTDNSTEDWNRALDVNKWRLALAKPDLAKDLETDYVNTNLAGKSNILSFNLNSSNKVDLPIDTAVFQGNLNLHHLTFLNNAAYSPKMLIGNSVFRKAFESTQNVKLQEDLRIAQAFNNYLNGRVNDAIILLDGLASTLSGTSKGEVLNSIGLMLLSQGASALAVDYFEKSAALNFNYATFNKAIALMENLQLVQARTEWITLIGKDSSYSGYYEKLEPLLSGKTEDSYELYYYKWQNYSPNDLKNGLVALNLATPFIESLWDKIAKAHIASWDKEGYQQYLNVFYNYLPDESRTKADLEVVVLDEKGIEGDGYNAFDEASTIGHVNYLIQNEELTKAYELLIDASSINPQSINYLKRYALLALELGLSDYATDALRELRPLLNNEEFLRFEKVFVKKAAATVVEF